MDSGREKEVLMFREMKSIELIWKLINFVPNYIKLLGVSFKLVFSYLNINSINRFKINLDAGILYNGYAVLLLCSLCCSKRKIFSFNLIYLLYPSRSVCHLFHFKTLQPFR